MGEGARRRLSGKLPATAEAAAELAFSDPDLISLREDMAAVEGMTATLYETLRDGAGTADQWAQVARLVSGYDKAGGVGYKLPDVIETLRTLCDPALNAVRHRKEVRDWHLLRVQQVAAETQRLKAAADALSRDRAVAFAQACVLASFEVITSPDQRTALAARFRTMLANQLQMQAGDEVVGIQAAMHAPALPAGGAGSGETHGDPE